MEENIKQKRGGSGVGNTIKTTWNVGSVKKKNESRRGKKT